jgi:hypothetical protein
LLDSIGRSDRIRTYDPLIPNQMRYQAALRSAKRVIVRRDDVRGQSTFAEGDSEAMSQALCLQVGHFLEWVPP